MQQYLRLTRHRFFKRSIWRTRIIFWGGAVLVGLIAALFAMLADHADHLFRDLVAYNKYLPLVLTPLGLVVTAFNAAIFCRG